MQISSSQSLEGTFSFPKPSQLTDLDLKYCKANHEVLEQLLKSCHSLEKISLVNITLNKKMVNSIFNQNGKTLQVLNLSRCSGVNLESIQSCVNLVELNLEKINQNISADHLADQLSTKVVTG